MRTTNSNKPTTLLLLLSAVFSVFLPLSLNGQNIAISHCQGSCPDYSSGLPATRSNVVVHNLYAAGLNGDTGMADWVAYRLTKEAIGVASYSHVSGSPMNWSDCRVSNSSRKLRRWVSHSRKLVAAITPMVAFMRPLARKNALDLRL